MSNKYSMSPRINGICGNRHSFSFLLLLGWLSDISDDIFVEGGVGCLAFCGGSSGDGLSVRLSLDSVYFGDDTNLAIICWICSDSVGLK